VHGLRGIVSIAAEDGVRDGLGDSDRHVEPNLAGGESHHLALAAHELHDALDEADVARDVDLDDADVIAAERIVFV
jgi:hypothetical protein